MQQSLLPRQFRQAAGSLNQSLPHSQITHRSCRRRTKAQSSVSPSVTEVLIDGKSFQACPQGARLRDWLLEAGGYVHESLLVVQQAPCGGGRGVVAARELGAEAVEGGAPLVLLPEDLVLTSEVARCVAQCMARMPGVCARRACVCMGKLAEGAA